MKSHTLSGWPSVTDSDVKTKGWPFGPDWFSLTGRPSLDRTSRTPASARQAPRRALRCPGTLPGPHLPPHRGRDRHLGLPPQVAGPARREPLRMSSPNIAGEAERGNSRLAAAGARARASGTGSGQADRCHRGADAVGRLVEVGLVLEAEDGGVAPADHLRHEERDVDAALGEGPGDAVGEAGPVVAQHEEGGGAARGEAAALGRPRRLAVADRGHLDHRPPLLAGDAVAHHDLAGPPRPRPGARAARPAPPAGARPRVRHRVTLRMLTATVVLPSGPDRDLLRPRRPARPSSPAGP